MKHKSKQRPTFYIILTLLIIILGTFIFVKKYNRNPANKEDSQISDSTSGIVNSNLKLSPVLRPLTTTDTSSRMDFSKLLKYKYFYKGEMFDFPVIQEEAKQSKLNIDSFIRKAGILVFDDQGMTVPKNLLTRQLKDAIKSEP